jgi:carboxylate-amine ligase
MDNDLTIGVEEEFFVVDPTTRALCPDGPAILRKAMAALGDGASPELHQSQVETGTPVCQTLDGVRRSLVDQRRIMARAAEEVGARLVALGTHPFSHWADDPITAKEKYEALERDYQQVAREALICGCHVHVGIADPEAAIDVMNRARPHLPVILALTANSPYWLGADTGHASFRTEVWRRWPLSGPPERFDDRAQFDRVLAMLTATGSIDDPARIYWDIRPSARFPTVEFRVADVCTRLDEAVMVGGLARSLAHACRREAEAGAPVPDPRPELLRAAGWRAARYGIRGELIDVLAVKARPAAEMVDAFLTFLRPSLEEFGDWDEVSEQVGRILADGNGAERQRRAGAQGDLKAVVDAAAADTAAA